MDSQYKYEVVEPNEDIQLVKIRKSGISVDFTLLDVKNNIIYARQKIQEFQQMWRVAEATKKNILGTHPHIGEMSDEDLTAAYLYRQAIGTANEAQDKLKDWTEAMEMDEQALVDTLEQTGMELPKDPELVKTEEKPSDKTTPEAPETAETGESKPEDAKPESESGSEAQPSE